MTGRMRKDLVDHERLKTAATMEEMSRFRTFRHWDRVYIVVIAAWALLAALPSVHVGQPLPYQVGSTADADVNSRVDFTWHDSIAENAAVGNLESGYARRYREEPLAAWSSETQGAIGQMLTAAVSAAGPAEVSALAAELGAAVTPAQAEAIWHGATVARNDPYHYLVRPLKETLENDIFPGGILDQDRFDRERGRTIQIVRGGASYPAIVGGDRGPGTVARLADELARRIDARFSVWIPDDFKAALAEIVTPRIKPTLVYDEAGSNAELAERRVELISRVQSVKRHDRLLSRGEIISLDRLAKLRAEERAFRVTQGWQLPAARFIGNFVLFLALGATLAIYFRVGEGVREGVVRLFLSGAGLCLLPVLFGYWLIWMGLPGSMLPAGIVAGVAAIGMTTRTAIFLTSLSSLCGLILFEGRPDLMVGFLASSWFFVYTASHARWRTFLLFMAFASGVVGGVAFIAWNFARGDLHDLLTATLSWSNILDDSRAILWAALALVGNWLACGVLVLVLLPLIEWFFGVTSRIRLQDLASQEHPLLRRLVVEAPGTYHHSVIVSSLAEAGADAIGADGLKARIGALFHDIGKLVKPEYFTENEFGVSRHDNLSPHMSALIIINHVRDGEEMARAFGLPSVVADMIRQHHGTGLMWFFYNRAAAQVSPGAVVAREPFLYPGPKPQSPEAAVLMLADIVEAAVRSLDDPSPRRLRTLVTNLVRERLLDGQLEEAGLTMSQVSRIGEIYVRMLASMFHTRVKYPGKAAGKQERKR